MCRFKLISKHPAARNLRGGEILSPWKEKIYSPLIGKTHTHTHAHTQSHGEADIWRGHNLVSLVVSVKLHARNSLNLWKMSCAPRRMFLDAKGWRDQGVLWSPLWRELLGLQYQEDRKPRSRFLIKLAESRFAEGFPDGTSGKEHTCQCRRHKRCRFDPCVGKIPWRRAWQLTPVFLPGESHGQRSLVGYGPSGHKELNMTQATYNTNTQELQKEGKENEAGCQETGVFCPQHCWPVPF